ncbi:MAG: SGNH/GDSL hydrolase family protein [Candidatus Hydrogenedentes bacterium]|nr:SGNH/GDSL hydrolase family protein [Candidatus Hydrogenedentota bacterium]
MMHFFNKNRQYITILLLLLIIFTPELYAKTPRILLVGDSWAWFLYLGRGLRDALEDCGLGEFEEVGIFTTVPGSEARDWVNPKWLELVKRELDNHPTVDIVHLSVGGNDFLRHWRIDMSSVEKQRLFQQVVDDTEKIIRAILDMKPSLRLALIEYDYINKHKGKASCQELNLAGSELSKLRMEMCKKIDRCRYVQTYGLMQYYFGCPPDLPPHSVPLPGQYPDFQPFPGGNANYCNSHEAMMDDVHLSDRGYYYLALFCVQTVYRDWLLNPLRVEVMK